MSINMLTPITTFHSPYGRVHVLAYNPGTPAITHLRPEDCDPGDPAECDFIVYDDDGNPRTLCYAEEDAVYALIVDHMQRSLLDAY